MSNLLNLDKSFNLKQAPVETNIINLKRFKYSLSTRKLSIDLSNKVLPDDLLDRVKIFLKEKYPELVRQAFGSTEYKKKLYEVISTYTSEKNFRETHSETVSKYGHDRLVNLLLDSIAGLDVLEELLKIPTLTDINVNAYDDIWIDDYLTGKRKTDLKFESKQVYETIVNKLMNEAGTSWSHVKPQASGALPQLRFDVLGSDLSPDITLSIRVHSKKLRISSQTIIETKQASAKMVAFMEEIMKARTKIMVSGQTGTGKTELMKWLIGSIPTRDRILALEDLKELFLKEKYPDKNIVEWLTREIFDESIESWDLGKLAQVSLRHYPNWFVVGETRGKELYHMIKVAQTGHSLLTGIHADDAEDQIPRSIDLMKEFISDSDEVYGKKLTKNLNIGIHLDRIGEREIRTITKFVEFEGYENSEVQFRTLFEYDDFTGEHIQKDCVSEKLLKLLVRSPEVNLEKIDFILPKSKLVI